jgi:uncharacterized repeat protein (TIGR03803 family)
VKRLYNLVGACLSAALLASCGGSNSFSSSTPTSAAPPLAPLLGAPGLPQSLRSQPAFGRSASHRIKKNVQIESVLHSFTNTPDGDEPHDALTNVGGTLYGTTYYGGASGNGTVFKSTTSGAESVLYSFAGGSDGEAPWAGLLNVGGTLYGTTFAGGAGDSGTVFALLKKGPEFVLYSFAGGSDGANPATKLTNVGGTLYGMTERGGSSGFGTIFSFSL